LAIPSVLAALWGIEGGLDNFRNAWTLSIISIGLVLIWRYFSHYLDDDIVKTYIDVVKIENRLHVPLKISLFNNLIESFQHIRICSEMDPDEELFQFIKNLVPEKRINFFECLLNDKKMGARGHDKCEWIALILTVIFSIGIITKFGFIPIMVVFIAILLCLYVLNPANYHKDPTIYDLKDALKKIGCPFKEF
jgi:hypothetical protein